MKYGLTCILLTDVALPLKKALPLKDWCDILSRDIGKPVNPEDLHITFTNVGFQDTVTLKIVTKDYLAECQARDTEV